MPSRIQADRHGIGGGGGDIPLHSTLRGIFSTMIPSLSIFALARTLEKGFPDCGGEKGELIMAATFYIARKGAIS